MNTSNTDNLQGRRESPAVLRKPTNWQNLNFYRRSEILYQLTVVFCCRFLPRCGDRTVDQMIQAARSTKQNIIEGFTDGQTSFDSELRLLGISRGSCQELLADYHDYLTSHGLIEWKGTNPRFETLLDFCRTRIDLNDYQRHFDKWRDDEMANCAICLAHLIDNGLDTTIKKRSEDFTQHGGLKERMYAARTGYRQQQDDHMKALEAENARLKAENQALRKRIEELERVLGIRES